MWKGPSPEDTLTKLWNSGIMSSRAPPAMHCKVTLSSRLLMCCHVTVFH